MSDAVRGMFDVEGRVCLVTGSTAGLGLAMARALYVAGATVVINGRDQARTESAAEALEEACKDVAGRGQLVPLAGDVSGDAAGLVERVVDACGALDVVVNNAGVNAEEKLFEEHDDDTWEWINKINVEGPVKLTRAALPHLRESSQPRIIFLSSMIGHVAGPANCPYAVSKGAILQLMRTLAVELAPHQITVNAISPGVFVTRMNAKFEAAEKKEAIEVSIPMHRMGNPEELAGALLLLASKAGSYMTGQSIVVDGGFTAA